MKSDAPTETRRNLTGWVFLAILFGLLLAMALYPKSTNTQDLSDWTRLDREAKLAVSQTTSPLPNVNSGSEVKKLIEEVAPNRFKSAAAAEVYGLMKLELHQKFPLADVAAVQTALPQSKRIFELLMAPSASKPDLLELASKVPEGSFLDKLLKADLEAKAGRPQSRSELLHGLSQSTLVQGGAVAFLLLGGISAWIFVFSFLLSGQALPMGRVSEGGSNPPSGAAPLGLPNLPKTLPDADKMAIKAVHFFAIYLVLLALADVLSGKLENRSGVLSIIVVLVTIACYPIALRSKGLGIGYSFTNLGIGRDAPWAKYIGIGLLSFFLEFPVSLLMASIGERVFPNQTFAHPAESVLAGSHNPLVFLALGLTACVQAPLFEETLFRGLLLPGLTKLIGSFGVSVCVTGLLFASLHPQGLGAWPGLFTIATAGCIATYYTRSLGPSIAMHAFHNGFTLLLAYFFS